MQSLCLSISWNVGVWSHLVWNSLLSSQLKQETGQGLWVLCGEERLFRS